MEFQIPERQEWPADWQKPEGIWATDAGWTGAVGKQYRAIHHHSSLQSGCVGLPIAGKSRGQNVHSHRPPIPSNAAYKGMIGNTPANFPSSEQEPVTRASTPRNVAAEDSSWLMDTLGQALQMKPESEFTLSLVLPSIVSAFLSHPRNLPHQTSRKLKPSSIYCCKTNARLHE